MNLKLLIPVGLITFFIGLVTNLPAPIAAGWITSQVPGLLLTGVSGSAFEGRAQYAGIKDITLEDVRWQLSPWSLLTGRAKVNLKVSTDAGSISGDLSQSLLGKTRLQNLNGSASLGWLGGLAGYRFVPLDGLLSIQDLDADVEKQQLVHAKGRIQVKNANWLLLKPPIKFGNFTGTINSSDTTNALRILESDGALKVEGDAKLANSTHYAINLRVRTRAGADERLKKLLNLLGKPNAEGWYRISERGRL